MSKSLKTLLLFGILISFWASPSHSLFVKKSIEVDDFADYDEQKSYAIIRVDFRKNKPAEEGYVKVTLKALPTHVEGLMDDAVQDIDFAEITTFPQLKAIQNFLNDHLADLVRTNVSFHCPQKNTPVFLGTEDLKTQFLAIQKKHQKQEEKDQEDAYERKQERQKEYEDFAESNGWVDAEIMRSMGDLGIESESDSQEENSDDSE